jgi:predicted ATPase/DNA-binding NarL/FixJ family response regulator/transcriptional regulator with XRE-family HTH domain
VTAQPTWNTVLRALREARGVSQDGWAAQLGFSRRTLQRWEQGDAVPDAAAEEALIALCADQGLFRTYNRGPLAGIALTADSLRALLADARLPRHPAAGEPLPAVNAPAPSTNLPIPVNSFAGRQQERADLARLLGVARLVTLTGPGGSGKTRLAVEVARSLARAYPDGVFFVDLAPLTDPELVPAAVAAAVGVPERRTSSLRETLAFVLGEKRLLLVLDNFEHLLAAAEFVAFLLQAGPDLSLLVTSRAPLRVRGEREYPLSPLPLPPARHDTASVLATNPAVTLFVARAQDVRPDFELTDENARVVATICTRLDGLPLAIELAAPRIRLLPPAALLARLDQTLPLLTTVLRDAPARQRSLRETIAWSYKLLEEPEQRLFRRLAVFVGGWTLEAAEAVCAEDGAPSGDVLQGIESLLEKHLLRRLESPDDHPRFSMLETIREFARERLVASGELDLLQRRHAALFLALAESAEIKFSGPERTAWASRLEREHGNLRAALASSQSQPDTHELFARLAVALAAFWHHREYWTEGRAWLERAATLEGSLPLDLRARALAGAGALALQQQDLASARERFTASLALRRRAADRHGIAVSFQELGTLALHEADYTAAEAAYEESLAIHRELGDDIGTATLLDQLGRLAEIREDHATARRLCEQSLATWQALGDEYAAVGARHMLANILIELGEYGVARELFEENLAWCLTAGDLYQRGATVSGLGALEYARGNFAEAQRLLAESIALIRAAGESRGAVEIAHMLGWAMHERGDLNAANAVWQEMLGLGRSSGDLFGVALHLDNLGLAARLRGDYRVARALHEEALAIRRRIGQHCDIAKTLGLLAEVNGQIAEEARARGSLAEARRCLERRVAYLCELGNTPQTLVTLHELRQLVDAEGDLAAARGYAEQTLELCRASGDQRAVAAALADLGEVATNQGERAHARELYLEALALRRQLGQAAGIAQALYDLGWLAQLEGDLAVAQKRFEESVAAFRRAGDDRGAAAALCNLAEAVLAGGRAAPAQAMYVSAFSTFADHGDRRGMVACCEGLAQVAVAQRDFTRATRLLGAAQGLAGDQDQGESAAELTSVLRAALGQASFAEALADGRSLSLEQLTTELRAQADSFAPERITKEDARGRGADGGRSASPSEGALPHGLSAREAEVVRLIAAGKSNRQIAEALVISPNTVLRHVTHILSKTGCANRTEVARHAAERHLT